MSILDKLFGKNKNDENAGASASVLAVLPEEIYESAKLELQDIIAPSALKIESKSINLGDKIARTFFIISYPRFLSDNWFSPIINLDKVFDISIFIHPIDTSLALRQFQKKVAEVQSQISVREGKGMVRDPMLDTAYQDLEGLRDNLIQAQQKMFDVSIYITVYADNDLELYKVENEIKSILESRLIYIKPALFQQEEGFKSVIPLGNDLLDIHQKLNSEPLSSVFPFVSFDLTSDMGILYGVNRHNSSLVIFDRFSLENYNSVTFAKSGSGKSYATKLEILRSLMFDVDIIVIDPEREYEYLAESVGGRYFNISLSSDHHINPFDLPIPREDESAEDVLRSNIINLVGLFRLMLGGLTPEEDSNQDSEADQELVQVAAGTGFIVSEDGYVVTNRHVAESVDAVYTVITNEDVEYNATIVDIDPFFDIAVLKIDGENLPTVTFGDSDGIQVGQTVIAIGNALSQYQNTVTKGVISGIDRRISAYDRFNGSEVIEGAIQTDAAINPGNSGGPLINLFGEVIGMNTAVSSNGQGLGFAIPINEVKSAMEGIKKEGRIVRPWLGVHYIQLSAEYAKENSLPVEEGALITASEGVEAVVADGPAAKAGLQKDDIVTKVDSKILNEENTLSKVIRSYLPGDTVILSIIRSEQTLELSVTLEEYAADE